MVTHMPDYCGKNKIEKVLLRLERERDYRIENAYFVHQQQGLFLSVYVDDIKLDGRKQNLNLIWKKLMKLVDLGQPTSFLDHVYSGSTQRECKSNESIVDEYRKMFASRISAWATCKLVGWEKNARGNSRLVLRHGRSFEEMRGKILRISE